MRRRHSMRLGITAAAALLIAAAAPLPPDQVAATIAQRYGVKVLSVKPSPADDGATYRVVVMNPGGNANDAFGVTALVVDAATGDLVPQFRNLASGYDLAASPDRTPPADDSGAAIRRMTYRNQ
jgi:hypothetical protein